VSVEPASRLLLIRHAHVDADGRLCGRFEARLSASGRQQLDALRSAGRRQPAPAALYTSPLARARDVAAVLGELWGLSPGELDAASEIDCGTLDGMRLDDVRRDFPHHWHLNQAQVDSGFAWPGGESYARFRARVLAAFTEIAACHPGQRVAVVTHAGVISQVLGRIRGRPAAVWDRDRPDPLSATEVVWSNGSPLDVLRFNDPDWY
jgi:broad specificity phosphatase PhoE